MNEELEKVIFPEADGKPKIAIEGDKKEQLTARNMNSSRMKRETQALDTAEATKAEDESTKIKTDNRPQEERVMTASDDKSRAMSPISHPVLDLVQQKLKKPSTRAENRTPKPMILAREEPKGSAMGRQKKNVQALKLSSFLNQDLNFQAFVAHDDEFATVERATGTFRQRHRSTVGVAPRTAEMESRSRYPGTLHTNRPMEQHKPQANSQSRAQTSEFMKRRKMATKTLEYAPIPDDSVNTSPFSPAVAAQCTTRPHTQNPSMDRSPRKFAGPLSTKDERLTQYMLQMQTLLGQNKRESPESSRHILNASQFAPSSSKTPK